jgi:hypothetical protein
MLYTSHRDVTGVFPEIGTFVAFVVLQRYCASQHNPTLPSNPGS